VSPDSIAAPIALEQDGARVEISPYGGQVLTWTVKEEARLFLSLLASHRTGDAIRGGIPVIFPQFADFGELPKHGFARTRPWSLLACERTPDSALARLRMTETNTLALWPHQFELDLVVTLKSDALSVALAVSNTGDSAFDFTAALHTYLAVSDIDHIEIHGLSGQAYSDTTAGGVKRRDHEPHLKISGEVDRIYHEVMTPVWVRDGSRETRLCAAGFTDVVVWNPGPQRAAALTDLEPEGYRRMVCVEAAVVGVPVRLPPQQCWRGEQVMEVA
jgi:glucose-6-phosphate 1-epimerase